ncbi:hypothetical protein OKA06_07265 [Novosphingobium sp. MW5]|nr:hypothetical protein [Novosphingobium sp. MW5]
MRRISTGKAAFVTGLVVGVWHAMWAALVATGLAQGLVDFILRLHFMRLEIAIAPFELGTAALLVVITFAVGAAFGLCFALVWNYLGSGSRQS